MKHLRAVTVALWVSVALAPPPALARSARAPVSRSCCRVPAGSVVEVELAAPVSTQVQKAGDSFALRLAAPLVVNGQIVLRAGTPGAGVVIECAKPGLGGKPAKLVLAARYLTGRHGRVLLQGLQLTGAGRDRSMASNAVGLAGIAFAPLGFVALALTGGDVELPAGARATAKVVSDLTLPSLGRAPRHAATVAQAIVSEPIAVPPPPAGQGQVVFFREKSLLGSGQWFKVREAGKELGKLTNGAYFVHITGPGVHSYTAKSEPEMKDRLRLEVDPGETYFVEGALTKGLVIGVADLLPSTRARFDKVARKLKPLDAAAGGGTEQPDNSSAQPTVASSSVAHQAVLPQASPHH